MFMYALTNLNPFNPRMICTSFGWYWLGKRSFFKFVNIFSPFRNQLPLKKGMTLHLDKLEFPPPKNALCQVWSKLAQLRQRWQCEKFTDGQTDDEQQVIRKAHLSFLLRWAKKVAPFRFESLIRDLRSF